MYSIWTTFPINRFPTCFHNKHLQIYETYNLCHKWRYTRQTFSYWKRKRGKNKISYNGRRIGPRGWIKRNRRLFSANLDVFSREFVSSILIPRKQAKRLGLAEFQDRGASAKSESATSSGMWDGSKRSVRRISGTGQTRRRSRVGQNQGSASFNNITIPDVLPLSLHPAADHPIYIANEQVLFL